ncbi:HEAT repeat domain-containing protein [Candidatus Auribacterota bacterium]
MARTHTLMFIALFLVLTASQGRSEEKITHFGPGVVKTEVRGPETKLSKAEINKLVSLLAKGDKKTRLEAQWELRIRGDKAAQPGLISLLKDKDPAVRQMACKVLGEIGDKKCLPYVARLLVEDKNERVKNTAADVLTVMGDRSVVSSLVKAVNQPRSLQEQAGYWVFPNDIYDNYRYAAVTALNRITGKRFFYRRNETNFNRIAAVSNINKWWKENSKFYTKDMNEIANLSYMLLENAKKLNEQIKAVNFVKIMGGEDFARHIKEFQNNAKSLNKVVAKLPASKKEAAPLLAKLHELSTYIDEIFIYSGELANLKSNWEMEKDLLKKINVLLREKFKIGK